MLIGYVGRDPEVKYYDADQCMAQVSIATTERAYVLPNGTLVPERTDWHNLVFWEQLAKAVERYVHKGDKIYVEGRIRYRAYDDKKGMRRYVTEIYVDNMELLSSRSSQTSSATPAQQPAEKPRQATAEDVNKLPF